jgi:hypothetical protein
MMTRRCALKTGHAGPCLIIHAFDKANPYLGDCLSTSLPTAEELFRILREDARLVARLANARAHREDLVEWPNESERVHVARMEWLGRGWVDVRKS